MNWSNCEAVKLRPITSSDCMKERRKKHDDERIHCQVSTLEYEVNYRYFYKLCKHYYELNDGWNYWQDRGKTSFICDIVNGVFLPNILT